MKITEHRQVSIRLMATLKGDLRRLLENLPAGTLSHHDIILRLALVVTRITMMRVRRKGSLMLLEDVPHRPNQTFEVRNAVKGFTTAIITPTYHPTR